MEKKNLLYQEVCLYNAYCINEYNKKPFGLLYYLLKPQYVSFLQIFY